MLVQYNSDTYTSGLGTINGNQNSYVTVSPLQVSAGATSPVGYCNAYYGGCSYYQITATSQAAQAYCHSTAPNITTTPDYFYFTIAPKVGFVLTMTSIQITCGSYGTAGTHGAQNLIMGYQDGASAWVSSGVYSWTASTTGGGSSGSGVPAPITVPGSGCASMTTFVWTLGTPITTNNTVTIKFIPYNANSCDCSTHEFAFTQVEVDGPCVPILLPIDLLFFKANKQKDNTILLNWATASETNNNYFDLEYSFDALNFLPYKQIKGSGTSNTRKDYSSVFDLEVGTSVPYFRLKQVDLNGDHKYSNIISVENENSATNNLNTYYNADTKNIISHFNIDKAETVNFSLYDISGNLISVNSEAFQTGEHEILLNAPENTGVYFLVFQKESGLTVHKKIFITK